MSDRIKDLQGTVVSEEEVAKGLGFKDVFELRRWQTDLGHQMMEAQAKLREAESDRDNFRWVGRRMMKVLEKAEPLLMRLQDAYKVFNQETAGAGQSGSPEAKTLADVTKVLLALRVVCGLKEAPDSTMPAIDWGNTLDDWWQEVKNEDAARSAQTAGT